ncbi:hypothetical protein L6164_005445 [Bauhinia variegata]|uniref:Uncharacterized protein n=1 Tax=Bauhinia variegata TaxID=167791 RepID=A0ACB9PQW3_BAUVA|nr:hypothetical protein L6164_005445 [Bauhinia variegata]
MANNLDMSLDDLIEKSKRSSGNGVNHRGRGRNYGGPGPDRRFADRKPFRTTPYSNPKPMQLMQTMFLDGGSGAEAGTKLYISNLDYGVSNDDLKLLFSEVGELKRHSIHYDKSGRSKGIAEVVFIRQSDAIAAIKRYNNVRLDGKPLKIELVGVNVVSPIVMPPPANSKLGKPQGDFTSGLGRGRGGGFRNGNWRGHRPTGRRQERACVEKVKLTAKDLDADLERYRLAAIDINKE